MVGASPRWGRLAATFRKARSLGVTDLGPCGGLTAPERSTTARCQPSPIFRFTDSDAKPVASSVSQVR